MKCFPFHRSFLGIALPALLLAGLMTGCGDDDPVAQPEQPEQPEQPVKPTETFNQLAVTPHQDGEPYDTYQGLIMAGYQGWFCAPGSGCKHGNQFYHYQGTGGFNPGPRKNTIDFWPDMTEYTHRYDTNFRFADGTTAQVYSNYDESTVRLHFKWMQEYGVDGVFMQRFLSEACNPNNQNGKDHFNTVLRHAMKASNDYQRAICVMYDCSGANETTIPRMLADAEELMQQYQLADRSQQRYYLYENGKPLIVLWGIGFRGRTYDGLIPGAIDHLKSLGYSVMLGVSAYWREGGGDAPDAGSSALTQLHNTILKADVIMPWYVGRYSYDTFSSGGWPARISSDVQWCKRNKVGYAPLCYPGLSDRNMYPNNRVFDRYKGRFYWNQLYTAIKSGAQMIYVAMFDEIDEGTAIYKVMPRSEAPVNTPADDYWVNYVGGEYSISPTERTGLTGNDWSRKASALDIDFQGVEDGERSDHYLWLTGQARLMLRGEIPMNGSLPKQPE